MRDFLIALAIFIPGLLLTLLGFWIAWINEQVKGTNDYLENLKYQQRADQLTETFCPPKASQQDLLLLLNYLSLEIESGKRIIKKEKK